MRTHEVVVVGAGMAGLSCAVELTRRGVDVGVLEAADAPGGRIRTDTVDGMLLDRGFQLLNPAYPALRGLVDLTALDLRSFERGVLVASRGRRTALVDPFRAPLGLVSAMGRGTGSPVEKAFFATYTARCALAPAARLQRRPDVGYGEALDAAHIRGRLRRSVLEPFLAGVLAEDDQQTSRRFVDLLLRVFARGTPALPAQGMQALPGQVAAELPADCLQCGVSVEGLDGLTVKSAAGDSRAEAVVIATDPASAARLTGLPAPTTRALTTFYHHTETSPAARALLHVDGDRDGPVVNTAVVSDVARTYCSKGSLVASTVLGANDSASMVRAVTRQLASIYGVDTGGWELVASYPIAQALPAMLPPLEIRQPVDLGDGLFVAGDHRDTASIQGAIVSGRRAAAAVAVRLGR
jgi:phytoene dehydrogenase-like protein